MLACLDSSSVTVRNNEIFVKEIQYEYRNGDKPSVFTMCRELGCCPAQDTMMDHFFSHGVFAPSVQDRGCSSVLWQMLEVYSVFWSFSVDVWQMSSFSSIWAAWLRVKSPLQRPSVGSELRLKPHLLHLLLFLVFVCPRTIINDFSWRLLQKLSAYNF